MIKDSGGRTQFATGAVRDVQQTEKGRFDLLPWYAIHDVARHSAEGALKYGERNVDLGIPQRSLLDSAIRHIVRYIHGETDEPHLRAAAWNVLWALEQETTHPELIDLPERQEEAADASCGICKYVGLTFDEFPCNECMRGLGGYGAPLRFEKQEAAEIDRRP